MSGYCERGPGQRPAETYTARSEHYNNQCSALTSFILPRTYRSEAAHNMFFNNRFTAIVLGACVYGVSGSEFLCSHRRDLILTYL